MYRIIALVAFTVVFVSQISIVLSDGVICQSLDPSAGAELWFVQTNPNTVSCAKCTQHDSCSWCKKGKAKNIKILGVTQGDIELSNFCWTGNPFGLTGTNANFTMYDKTYFEVECDDIAQWHQCQVSGSTALIIFFVLFAAMLLVSGSIVLGVTYLAYRYYRLRGYQPVSIN